MRRAFLRESGLVGQLKKQLAERMLAAELTHHLKTEAVEPAAAVNPRNGSSPKTVVTPGGPLALDIPPQCPPFSVPSVISVSSVMKSPVTRSPVTRLPAPGIIPRPS
jgi:hypothetical protein